LGHLVILFTANQNHLSTSPKIVVKTSKLAVWTLTVLPGEKIDCTPVDQVDFVRCLSPGTISITDKNGYSILVRTKKDATLSIEEGINVKDLRTIENVGTEPIKFMSVETII